MQPIKHVVDALVAQRRLIIHLICGHNISVSVTDYQARQAEIDSALHVSRQWPCHHCPDAPPPEKTVIQLWKEAGEP